MIRLFILLLAVAFAFPSPAATTWTTDTSQTTDLVRVSVATCTTGTSAARNADVATVATPSGLDPARWCVETVATPRYPWSSRAGTQLLWNTHAGALPNASWLNVSNTVSAGTVYDSAGAARVHSYTHGFGATETPHKFSVWNSSGTIGLRVDGAAVGTTTGAGTGVQTAFLGTITLGSQSGLYYHDGYLRDFKVYRSPGCR